MIAASNDRYGAQTGLSEKAEYCRYALHRAWFYYPDALPAEAIAKKQREPNGHVDRKLCFPLEDLYADG